jgi:H+/Cl- antiporter ClcA/environmental stress-induced protein Ves
VSEASQALLILRAAERRAVPWKNGGGVTREVTAHPSGSDLEHFDWRVSLAQVRASNAFSSFPAVDRRLAVIEGCLALSIEEGAPVRLAPGTPPLFFAGEAAASAEPLDGEVMDLNVMTRRGRFDARMTLVTLPLSQPLELAAEVTVIVSLADLLLTVGQSAVQLARLDAVQLRGPGRCGVRAQSEAGAFYLIEISAHAAAVASATVESLTEPLPQARALARDARRTLMSGPRWRERLVLWGAGLAVGGAAVAFAWLADSAQALLQRLLTLSPWWPCLLAPVGFCAISWVTRRYFPGAEGSGIPQTIFAQRPDSGAAGLRLLRWPLALGRALLAAAALLCGGSIGREGPTVHVGAVIAHTFGRWMPHGATGAQRRMLLLADDAAGVAAAFNTPLAGIVFAVEELSRSFEERTSGAALTAVILAGVISIALVGDYSYFGHPVVELIPRTLSPGVIAVAIVGGITGGLFSRLTLVGAAGLPGSVGRLQKARPALFAALCGIVVAALGIACGGITYGTGYTEAKSVLVGGAHLPWFYAPARALATLVTYLSGVPAGLLAPSLSVGAGLGQIAVDVSGYGQTVPGAILGMCAYLAGVTQAPLTSFVIVMEMTQEHAMLLPLMVTAAIATAVSKLLSPPLYQTLARRYVPQG